MTAVVAAGATLTDGRPETKLDHLLRLIEASPGPLDFADPPDLSAVRAGRDDLHEARDEAPQRWRDNETDGLALVEANLVGATLSHAGLQHANLRRATLSKAVGQAADISHAILEEARLDGSDFGGANFASIKGGEADFTGAMLEDARFDQAVLRFATLRDTALDAAVFTEADLWGASLEGTDADEANFSRARLDEAVLTDGNFSGASFVGGSLKKANLARATLRAADFSGAHLEGANLAGADLSGASLPRLNLLSCDLKHIRLAGAWLELTRLQARQLGGALGEEIAGDFDEARQAYIGLEQNFRTLGDSDDASWAFRKRRVMGKKHAAQLARNALRSHQWIEAIRQGSRWGADMFVEWLCDFGESLGRVVRAFLVSIAAFALLYGLTGALIRMAPGGLPTVTRNPLDLIAYSFLDMLSTSMPDIGIKPRNELVVIVSSMQGALGIVLIGLFGYVLGNKMRQ